MYVKKRFDRNNKEIKWEIFNKDWGKEVKGKYYGNPLFFYENLYRQYSRCLKN